MTHRIQESTYLRLQFYCKGCIRNRQMQRPRGKVRESQSFCVLRTFHHWAFDVYNHREDSPEGVPWWPRFRITGFYCHSLGSIPGWGTEILQSIQLCFFFFFLKAGEKRKLTRALWVSRVFIRILLPRHD